MTARIYKPARSAMQQGLAPRDWVLEYEPDKSPIIEPLMGWTSGLDTRAQVRLSFATKEEAIAFARRQGIAYRLMEPKETEVRPKSYAENFKFGRPDRWTH